MAAIDIDQLAQSIYYGQVTNTNLPEGVYHFNADHLMDAVFKGYGTNFVKAEYNSPDYKMLQALKDNIFMFSAAKTFQQTRELTAALVKDDGKSITPYPEFREKVAAINDQYNVNWLRTEYDTAIASSQQVSAWERIVREKEVLPMLTYSTIGDACDICAPLNGITLPVTDPFWNSLYPPNHFNCRCLCTQHATDDAVQTDKETETSKKNQVEELMDAMFMHNVGKLEEVFSKEHPYFMVPEKYADFAKSNFGLKIPNEVDEEPDPAIPDKMKAEPRVHHPKKIKPSSDENTTDNTATGGKAS
jgi:SPP1 gp7 family putative phage head morphogenesis protein